MCHFVTYFGGSVLTIFYELFHENRSIQPILEKSMIFQKTTDFGRFKPFQIWSIKFWKLVKLVLLLETFETFEKSLKTFLKLWKKSRIEKLFYKKYFIKKFLKNFFKLFKKIFKKNYFYKKFIKTKIFLTNMTKKFSEPCAPNPTRWNRVRKYFASKAMRCWTGVDNDCQHKFP